MTHSDFLNELRALCTKYLDVVPVQESANILNVAQKREESNMWDNQRNEDQWRRSLEEHKVCHQIYELCRDESDESAATILRRYRTTTDRYNNADHALLMVHCAMRDLRQMQSALGDAMQRIVRYETACEEVLKLGLDGARSTTVRVSD